jgi:hypothetical protein
LSEKLEALQAILTHYTKKAGHVFKEEMVERTTIIRLDKGKYQGRPCKVWPSDIA